MIFDKLCGVVERHYPKLKYLLDDAKIFQFEGIPHEILPTLFHDKTDDEIDDMCMSFFMPYQTVAIEDGASCIVLHDPLPDTVGLDNDRLFIEAAYPFSDGKYYETKFFSEYERKIIAKTDDIRPLTISFGSHKISEWDRNRFGATGKLIKSTVIDKHKVYCDDIVKKFPTEEEEMVKGALINVAAALQEIMFFNQPDKFILERRPLKKKKLGKGWIARSIWRPVYTILHPAEIRKRMQLTGSKARGPLIEGFDRRRHVRYLSHEKYAEKDDLGRKLEPKVIPNGPRRGELYYKKTIIPATWVGQSESIIGNKRYKVILDR